MNVTALFRGVPVDPFFDCMSVAWVSIANVQASKIVYDSRCKKAAAK